MAVRHPLILFLSFGGLGSLLRIVLALAVLWLAFAHGTTLLLLALALGAAWLGRRALFGRH